MIRMAGGTFLALALLLPAAWGGALLGAGGPARVLAGTLSRMESAMEGSRERERIVGEAVERSARLGFPIGGPGGEGKRLLGAGLVGALMGGSVVVALLPFTICFILVGVSAGLASRERLRDGSGYASPWAAGLGRILLGSGGLWLGLFGLSPLPVPLGWVYLAPGALFLGALLYAAHLPPRI
ncbi:MAG TPA: hypothetical protein VEN81_01120 [Planctomycetota bacterium]|nr:hypothetical protein [Planctomycetota bacterium]